MALLYPILLGVTVAVGLWLLAVAGRAYALRLARGSASTLALGATLLRFTWAGGVSVPLTWLPDLEPFALAFSSPGSELAVLAFWVLAIAMWLEPNGLTGAVSEPFWPGMAHVATALAAGALTVTDFIPRVVSIDMVALITFASLALWRSARLSRSALVHLFVIFRLGDLSLLLLALWLGERAGTYAIDAALEAAKALPPAERLLILSAGVAAAWVKLGLPPAHAWAQDVAHLAPAKRLVLLGSGLPVLGAYLLYRLRPLVASLDAAPWLAGLGLLAALASLGGLVRRNERLLATARLLRLHGALALVCLSTPSMRVYLWSFVPLRLATLLIEPSAGLDAARARWP
ncbi:MAG: proton-conducting transporter membrane subunit [Chloroflexota bacterium]